MSFTLQKLVVSSLALVFSMTPALTALTLAPASARAATTNSIIKGSGPTLYWYASNGKRYVFPNSRTFYSWFSNNDFSRVQVIGDTELYTIQIGGNVTYRPGARLVKITTDPRVYAVSRYGVLRWVTSEAIARSLYGNSWSQWVDDIPDAFFANYTIGNPINAASEFNVSSEFNSVVNPSDNIGSAPSNTNPTNSNTSGLSAAISIETNATSFPTTNNDGLTITASVTNSSVPTDNLLINIYREGQTAPEQTCWSITRCVLSRSVPVQGPATIRYYADVFERSTNRFITRAYSSYITINSTSPSSSSQVSGSASLTSRTYLNNNGDLMIDLNADIGTSNLSRLYPVTIYHTQTGTQTYRCLSLPCPTTLNLGRPANISIPYHAVFYNASGNEIARAYTTAVYTVGGTTGAGYMSTTVSRSNLSSTESVTLTATIDRSRSTLPANWKIEILDPRTNGVIQTCQNVYTCSTSLVPGIRQGVTNIIFHALLKDLSGNLLRDEWFPTISVYEATNAPVITSPTAQQVLTTYPRAMTVQWQGVNSQKYRVQLECDYCGYPLWSGPASTFNTDNYQTSVSVGGSNLPGDNQYRVRVRAIGTDGSEGPWSEYTYFRFQTSAAPTSFTGTVTASVNPTGLYTYDPVTVTAQVSTETPASQLTINIYDERDNSVIKTCQGMSTCTVTTPVIYTPNVASVHNQNPFNNSFRYYVKVNDNQNRTLPTVYSPTVTVAPAWQANVTYQDIAPAQNGSRRVSVQASIDAGYANQMGGTPSRITIYNSRFWNPIQTCDNVVGCGFEFTLGIPSENESFYASFTIGNKVIYSPFKMVQP